MPRQPCTLYQGKAHYIDVKHSIKKNKKITPKKPHVKQNQCKKFKCASRHYQNSVNCNLLKIMNSLRKSKTLSPVSPVPMALQVSTPQVIVLTPHTSVLTSPRQSPTEYVPNWGGHTPNRLLDACHSKIRSCQCCVAGKDKPTGK